MIRAVGELRPARWLTVALLLAAAGGARATSVSLPDGPIVLGETSSAPVVIELDADAAAADAPLRLSVNVGSFGEPARIGPGTYRTVYAPPSTRFPQVALVAIWRETGPDARVDFLRLPLLGAARVPVTAKPGARVRVRVGAELFGPVTADGSGRAAVPVVIAPGVSRCEVMVKPRRGPEVSRTVPVQAPTYSRVTAALIPQAVPADAMHEVRLDVFYDLDGAEVAPERIHVAPSAGAATLRSASRGRYTFRWAPPEGAVPPTVSFTISVAGDPTARATARLTVRGAPEGDAPVPAGAAPGRAAAGAPAAGVPARVVVTPPARPLRAGSGASAALDVLVLDATGAPVSGLTVNATANGEPLPAPAPRGPGRYEIPLAAPSTYPPGGLLQVEAVAHHPEAFAFGTVNLQVDPPARPHAAAPRLSPSPVPADGRTEARLLVEVRDEAGLPLEHARLVTVASHGSLGKLRERGRGLYEQSYVAPAGLPDADAVLRVMDASGAFERSFPIPLRPAPGRLLAGLGAGYARSPGVASGMRAAAELWLPVEVRALRLGVGASVGLGAASRVLVDTSGTLRSTAEATFVPVALKLGWEAWARRRLSVTVGAGPVAAWARFRSSLGSQPQQGVGLGWAGFLDLGWTVGPGVAVLGLSFGASPVSTVDYRVDPGGLLVTAGYRMRVLR